MKILNFENRNCIADDPHELLKDINSLVVSYNDKVQFDNCLNLIGRK